MFSQFIVRFFKTSSLCLRFKISSSVAAEHVCICILDQYVLESSGINSAWSVLLKAGGECKSNSCHSLMHFLCTFYCEFFKAKPHVHYSEAQTPAKQVGCVFRYCNLQSRPQSGTNYNAWKSKQPLKLSQNELSLTVDGLSTRSIGAKNCYKISRMHEQARS